MTLLGQSRAARWQAPRRLRWVCRFLIGGLLLSVLPHADLTRGLPLRSYWGGVGLGCVVVGLGLLATWAGRQMWRWPVVFATPLVMLLLWLLALRAGLGPLGRVSPTLLDWNVGCYNGWVQLDRSKMELTTLPSPAPEPYKLVGWKFHQSRYYTTAYTETVSVARQTGGNSVSVYLIRERQVRLPWNFWFVVIAGITSALLLLSACVILARLFRERRRRRAGQCLRCGYDLRSSPGRCPECGSEPESHSVPLANSPALP